VVLVDTVLLSDCWHTRTALTCT